VAEANNGGELVRHVLREVDPDVPVRLVHASRGKRTRAEPIAALYEQGRAHHVGVFSKLEDQMCSWVPGEAREGACPQLLTLEFLNAVQDFRALVEGIGCTVYGLRSTACAASSRRHPRSRSHRDPFRSHLGCGQRPR
jgi:hypothetical protein